MPDNSYVVHPIASRKSRTNNVLNTIDMSEESKVGCCCSGDESNGSSEPEKRLGWHEYFMSVAQLISRRATCTRGHIGAVIVRDHSILSTGYNGAPSGLPHCNDSNCRIYRSTIPMGLSKRIALTRFMQKSMPLHRQQSMASRYRIPISILPQAPVFTALKC